MEKQDHKFKPGQSGNPDGRPKGSKDKRTELRELLKPHADDLVKKAVDMALAGDTTALRICIDRIIPSIKARDMPISIPELTGSLTEKGEKVLLAMGQGEITPNDATQMLQTISAQARILEIDELEKRVYELEKKNES